MSVFEKLKTAARNRARYIETRDEIARLPLDVALDLGIFSGDAHQIAYQAVYGQSN